MQHHSFGLAALNQEIIQPGYRILDLGPLSVGTTQAYLQKNCPCYIEDLVEFFTENPSGNDLKNALSAHLVPKPERVKFDVILCWDLLNFFSTDLISHLMELLKPNLKPGTLLHAMMYSGSNPPARPAKFKLLKDFTYETANDPSYPEVAFQRHSSVSLMQSLGRFNLSNSLLQRQGMRKDLVEYIFEYESSAAIGKIQPGGASDAASYFSAANAGPALELKGLDTAISQARKSPVSKVIDCGPKTGRNISALEKQVGELFVLDLHDAIQWNKSQAGNGRDAIEASFSKFASLEPCDSILTWEMLSFYNPEEARTLCELLLTKLKPSGHLHLIFSKRDRQPQKPATFEVHGDSRVTIREHPAGTEKGFFSNITELIRTLPRMQLVGQGHGKLPGGAFYHELILKKVAGA